MSELDDQARATLLLEHTQPRMSEGIRSRYARERFGMSPTRYAQRLNQLLDHPAAVAEYPLVVHRLRRVRDSRVRRRRRTG